MTTLHHADASRTDFASTLADRLSRIVERVRKGLRNRRTVTRLDTLDDHVLADIGLTRADVREALSLPLTDDPSTHLSMLVRRRRGVPQSHPGYAGHDL